MIELCALASGSNGNCYYVGNERDAVLVDVGISAKQVLLRIEASGLNASKIRGIFVSHEHTDHVCGVRVLSKKLGVPVWFSQGTYNALRETELPDLYQILFQAKR